MSIGLEQPATIQTLEVETVFDNPFVRLDNNKVRFPNGQEGTYAVLTSGSGLGAVTIPVTYFRGIPYIGFVHQYRYPIAEHTIELPRGGTNDLGAPEAAREMLEELGCTYTSASRLGLIRPDTGVLSTQVAVWLLTVPAESVDLTHREDETGATASWYSHGQVLGMITGGKITCGMTLASLALLMSSGRLETGV